jgi:hypothetical protein
VFLLLDLKDLSVLEGPLDDVGLVRSSLDELALLDLGPEFAKVLELDQMPDIAELGLNDGRLADRSGCGDASRHDDGDAIGSIVIGYGGGIGDG